MEGGVAAAAAGVAGPAGVTAGVSAVVVMIGVGSAEGLAGGALEALADEVTASRRRWEATAWAVRARG